MKNSAPPKPITDEMREYWLDHNDTINTALIGSGLTKDEFLKKYLHLIDSIIAARRGTLGDMLENVSKNPKKVLGKVGSRK